MKLTQDDDQEEFDEFADGYQQYVDDSIRISGESAQYFAESRIIFLKKQLPAEFQSSIRILDFGCGVGAASGLLLKHFNAAIVKGIDVSSQSIRNAKRKENSTSIEYALVSEHIPESNFDLVYCSGVFHHIPLEERQKSVQVVFDSLRKGGVLSLWEHNPFNLGTRWAVSHCVFDKNAILLTPSIACKIMKQAGFINIRVRYLFIFPKFLRIFRWIEPRVSRIPIGAQFQVTGERS